MPRPDGCGREDERHGTTFESLPDRPWSGGCKPDDTALSPTERQHLRNASLVLSQLPQENRRGRKRASTDKTSDNEIRKNQISIQGLHTPANDYDEDLVPFTALLKSSTKRRAASFSVGGAVFLGSFGLVFKASDKAEYSKEQSHSGYYVDR